ncbi:hypothetical protein THAOC_14377, partial [Thalassiosira oceanica]
HHEPPPGARVHEPQVGDHPSDERLVLRPVVLAVQNQHDAADVRADDGHAQGGLDAELDGPAAALEEVGGRLRDELLPGGYARLEDPAGEAAAVAEGELCVCSRRQKRGERIRTWNKSFAPGGLFEKLAHLLGVVPEQGEVLLVLVGQGGPPGPPRLRRVDLRPHRDAPAVAEPERRRVVASPGPGPRFGSRPRGGGALPLGRAGSPGRGRADVAGDPYVDRKGAACLRFLSLPLIPSALSDAPGGPPPAGGGLFAPRPVPLPAEFRTLLSTTRSNSSRPLPAVDEYARVPRPGPGVLLQRTSHEDPPLHHPVAVRLGRETPLHVVDAPQPITAVELDAEGVAAGREVVPPLAGHVEGQLGALEGVGHRGEEGRLERREAGGVGRGGDPAESGPEELGGQPCEWWRKRGRKILSGREIDMGNIGGGL